MNWFRFLLRLALGRRLPTTTGTLAIPGLAARVTIRRDRWGIPFDAADAALQRADGAFRSMVDAVVFGDMDDTQRIHTDRDLDIAIGRLCDLRVSCAPVWERLNNRGEIAGSDRRTSREKAADRVRQLCSSPLKYSVNRAILAVHAP